MLQSASADASTQLQRIPLDVTLLQGKCLTNLLLSACRGYKASCAHCLCEEFQVNGNFFCSDMIVSSRFHD